MGNNRVQFLDGFRFMLALWVLVAHYYTLIGGTRYFVLPKFLDDTLNKPVMAVYGFMIITGFLMTYNYLLRVDKEPVGDFSTFKTFWLRRIFRLYPVYILAIIVAFIAYVPAAQFNKFNLIYFTGSDVSQWGTVRSIEQPSVADLVSHIFMVHGLVPDFSDSLLGVAWSLSLEMQFYFLFPFLFLAVFSTYSFQKNRLVLLLAFTCIAALVAPKLCDYMDNRYHIGHFVQPSTLLHVMPFFLLGMIAAAVKLRKIDPQFLAVSFFMVLPFQWRATNLLIALFFLLLFLDELEAFIPTFLYRIVNRVRMVLSGRAAGFGADISYSMYLIHTLIIGGAIQLVIRTMPSLAASKPAVALAGLVITLVISVSLGYLIFRFIEKPFIEIGKRFIKRRQKQEAVPVQAVE